MNSFHVKSVLLGIGIGIIITATASMIYVAGKDPMEGLTEQQILRQAEKYGMVRSSLLQGSAGTDNQGADGSGTATGNNQAGE